MSKQPYRPMTEIDIMEDAPVVPDLAKVAEPSSNGRALALHESEEETRPPPEGRRQINYRAPISVAERLRTISFRQRRPVQELLDEAVMLWLSSQR